MARLTNEKLEEIKQIHNVDRIWSYSRVNTFQTSCYEYFLKYILHEKEDRTDCAYTSLGSLAHDTLDDYYEGKIKYEDMIERFEDGWLTCIDIANLKLDRNDEEKNKKLSEKYKDNLQHFFKNHVTYANKLLIEKPVTIDVNGNIFVGYIDAMFKDDNGDITIIDFKTSSIFKGKNLEEHSAQLVLYALGVHQMSGIPLDKIKICFNFLKYVTIEYELKNGTVKERMTDRCKIGESLQSNAKTWLKTFGYEPDEYLKEMLDTNSIECLPQEVRDKYKLTDCHVYIPLSDELVNRWVDDISLAIKDIELRESDYKKTQSDKCFFDTEESVEKESYYFATLCGYSAKHHLPYKLYLDKLEQKQNGGDVFGGLLSNAKEDMSNQCDVTDVTSENGNANTDLNLDWLNDIEI